MSDTQQIVDQIRTIAWTLAKASADRVLDVPGEYIWACPANDSFQSVRDRSRSIFSSGNSIKDPDVIEFIQHNDTNRHMLDPWITQKFEEFWPSWIMQGKNHALKNLDLFTYAGYSLGSQESFLNFYLMNKDRRFRVFRGDYWWHMDIWTKAKFRWAYIEDDDLRSNDVCICSCPFALTGRRHHELPRLIDECERLGVDLLLDFIYLPNSLDQEVDVDLSAECVKTITFSMSKTFPVQCAKIAIRMCKTKPQDPMQMSNDENINNRLGSGLGLDIMQNFPVDYMVKKYRKSQEFWCDKLDLDATKVVHFAIGPDYTSHGRNTIANWCSPFNQQQNRYNLGMLFENKSLLEKIGLC